MARIKIDIPEEFKFSCTIPIRITDLNYGKHVGNDTVLGLIHEARLQYLQSLGAKDELDTFGVGLIMADVGIQFKGEVFYGTSVDASIAVTEITSKSFDLIYVLKASDSGKVVAQAKTGMLCFDYENKKIVGIPTQLLEQW